MNQANLMWPLSFEEKLAVAEAESAWLWDVILDEVANCRVCKGTGHAVIASGDPYSNGTGKNQDCYNCRSLRGVAENVVGTEFRASDTVPVRWETPDGVVLR